MTSLFQNRTRPATPRTVSFLRAVAVLCAWGMLAARPVCAAASPPKSEIPSYVAMRLGSGKQNQFFVEARINGRRAVLIVDTGSPITCIDASKARPFGLKPFTGSEDIPATVIANGETHRVTLIPSMRMGQVELKDTPAALIDLGEINRQLRATHDKPVDGILGLDLLFALKAVLDCGRHELILKTNPAVKSPFAATLKRGGWMPVPMRVVEGHLLVNGRVNAAAASFVVDTGSPVSALDRAFCASHKIVPSRKTFASRGIHFDDTGAGIAWVENFRIGKYDARRTPVAVFDLARLLRSSRNGLQGSGLLGSHTLQKNLAVIDCEGLRIWFRHGK